jgi:multicomponent Na+:H+ antiporter subunit D
MISLILRTISRYHSFWKPPPLPLPDVDHSPSVSRLEGLGVWLLPIAFLVAVTVALGLGAGPLFALAMRAGEELMDPTGYIQAVLGGAG